MFCNESQTFNVTDGADKLIYEKQQLIHLTDVTFDNTVLSFFDKSQVQIKHSGMVLVKENQLAVLEMFEEDQFRERFLFDISFSYCSKNEQKCFIELFKSAYTLQIQFPSNIQLQRFIDQVGSFIVLSGFTKEYIALESLGSGSSCNVYKVKGKSSGSIYAAKIISKKYIRSKTAKSSQLLNEINIHQALRNCSSVVKLHFIYEDTNSIYLLMDYLQGGTLLDFMHSVRRGLSEEEIVVIMEQLLLSVDLLHKNNIIHRDIKPENILIKQLDDCRHLDDFEIKLCDLGLAQRIEENEKLVNLCGTPGYMAPELLIERKLGLKNDIFSLGACMFTLLKATPLIKGMDSKEVLQANRGFKVDSILNRIHYFSQPIQDLLCALLEDKYEKRVTAKEALAFQLFAHDQEGIQEALVLNQVVQIGMESRKHDKRAWLENKNNLHMSQLIAEFIQEQKQGIEAQLFEEEEEKQLKSDKIKMSIQKLSQFMSQDLENQNGNSTGCASNKKQKQRFDFYNKMESCQYKHLHPNQQNCSLDAKKDFSYCQLLKHKRNNSSSQNSSQKNQNLNQSFFFSKLVPKQNLVQVSSHQNSEQLQNEFYSLEIGNELSLEDIKPIKIENYKQSKGKGANHFNVDQD